MAIHDLYGFLETVVEYYTGRDASKLSDSALVMKLAHIKRIRKIEGEESSSRFNNLFR